MQRPFNSILKLGRCHCLPKYKLCSLSLSHSLFPTISIRVYNGCFCSLSLSLYIYIYVGLCARVLQHVEGIRSIYLFSSRAQHEHEPRREERKRERCATSTARVNWIYFATPRRGYFCPSSFLYFFARSRHFLYLTLHFHFFLCTFPTLHTSSLCRFLFTFCLSQKCT